MSSTLELDNLVTPFHLEGQPVRGRVIRMGSVLNEILEAHSLPNMVARLLGEAVMGCALSGSSLKMQGRVVAQATGNGPVPFLVSDFVSDGGLRGYIRYDAPAIAKLEDTKPDFSSVMGNGQFALTIDPGSADKRYQGIAELAADSFAATMQNYFLSSEQIPSRLQLAVSLLTDENGQQSWRGGGLLVQRIASEEDEGDAWNTALALCDTISADELTDPDIRTDDLLYRLFHEQGVRRFDSLPLYKRCTCTRDRLREILGNFTRGERKQMVTDEGDIAMTCEYCAKTFTFDPIELARNIMPAKTLE